MKKFNVVTVAKVIGVSLTVASTVLSGYLGKKETEEAVAKEVAKQLSSKSE